MTEFEYQMNFDTVVTVFQHIILWSVKPKWHIEIVTIRFVPVIHESLVYMQLPMNQGRLISVTVSVPRRYGSPPLSTILTLNCYEDVEFGTQSTCFGNMK